MDGLLHFVNDLVQGEVRAVENDGIVGWLHGCEVPLGVAPVASFLSLEDCRQVQHFAAFGHFALTPFGTLGGISH